MKVNLLEKKTGYFICCGEEKENPLNKVYPDKLIENAVVSDCFGGAFLVSKMNKIDRFMVKKVGNKTVDSTDVFTDRIQRFAEKMNQL